MQSYGVTEQRMDDVKQHILEVAKAFLIDKPCPWLEPVEVQLTSTSSGERAWSVRTNIYAKGRSARLLIRESDFSIIEFGYLSR
jgi:hypothetical protein